MKIFDLLEQDLLSNKKDVDNQKKETAKVELPKKEIKKINKNTNFEISSDVVGLTSRQAEQRLQKDGKNELKSKKRINPLNIFFSQYKDIMTIILLICTAVSLFMGEYVEAIAIAVIVLMNGLLGFIQEYRTEKTLEALKGMASPVAKVYRNGVITQIHTSEIVIGDVVLLESGDKIPADGRLISSTSLECDESMLTGESIPVKKLHSLDLNSPNTDKKENVYMGCVITKGHCEFLVTATGMNTEMGNIASMLQTIDEEQTPLQIKLAQLSKYIAVGCLAVCAIVSVTGMLRGEDFMQMLITGVSLAVAAVPEGLPAIVTISLALAVSRMVKRNALVRRLHAVETLGCATVICSDKTGTLTENKMTATEVCLPNGRFKAKKLDTSSKSVSLLLNAITLCNNAIIYSNNDEDFGDHTEISLLNLSAKYNITRENLEEKFNRLSELPFDSERKRMSVVVEDEYHQKYLFVKGAFDILLNRCVEYQNGDKVCPMLASDKVRFNEQSSKMADSALRIIGVAYKKITPLSPGTTEDNLIFLGLVGMIDPPRKEVKKAVTRCHMAGIKTIMITGDHKKTATAIGAQVGIYHDGDMVITGSELDNMSLSELSEIVNKVTIFARVSPNHKLQIVKALKRRGHIVAMTGDGVNDAPAIKEADIGVSMGTNGTDVTKEASEIILLDDNFATLVNAVDEGRNIYDNIRKFIRYLLSCNIGEVMTMFVGMLMGMPVILLPIQILLINLVTDGLPAIALGLEPASKNAMSRPPRRPDEGVFSNGLATKIVGRGIFIGFTTLASFVSLFKFTQNLDIARSGALFALVFAQLIHVFECKSETKNLLHIKYTNNVKLILASTLSLVTVLLVMYCPPISLIFSTVPLTLVQILIPIGYCLIPPIVSIFLHPNK